MDTRRSFGGISAPVNKATRTLLVEYGPEESIHDALVSHGFRIKSRSESATEPSTDSRYRRIASAIQEKLDAVSDRRTRTITVT